MKLLVLYFGFHIALPQVKSLQRFNRKVKKSAMLDRYRQLPTLEDVTNIAKNNINSMEQFAIHLQAWIRLAFRP